MNRNSDITGIILAGGKSTRMGRDKGLLRLKDKLFIEHIIEALLPFVSSIIIVSDNKDYDRFNAKRVSDLIKEAGPMAGIYTGLYYSKTENNIILSCDVPFMDKAILKQLISENDASLDVVQVQSQDKTMPLIALYKRRCKHLCLILLESGERRLRVFVDQLKVKTILLDKGLEKHTLNVNTERDLKILKNEFDD